MGDAAVWHRGKAAKRGLSDEQIPVLICRVRAGETADFVLARADNEHISAILKPILATDAILCTDSGGALTAAAREMGVTHRPVSLAQEVRVIATSIMCRPSMHTTADSRN